MACNRSCGVGLLVGVSTRLAIWLGMLVIIFPSSTCLDCWNVWFSASVCGGSGLPSSCWIVSVAYDADRRATIHGP